MPRRLALTLLTVGAALLVAGLAALFGAGVGLGAPALLVATVTLYAQITGTTPLAPSPTLDVSIVLEGPGSSLTVVPSLDIEAIVDDEVKRCRSQYPPVALRPHMRPGADAASASIQAYARELREWLQGVERALWPSVAEVDARLVVRNTSDVPARDVAVEVDLAELFAPVSNTPDSVPPPPTFPADTSLTSLALRVPSGGRPRRILSKCRIDSTADGWQWRVRPAAPIHAHDEYRSDPEFILPAGTGSWDLQWTARASNSRRPSTGTVRVTVGAPAHRITTLKGALEAGVVVDER